jgi:hypothetical protein
LAYALRGAGYDDSRLAAFAVSNTEPPPTETKPSTVAPSAKRAASSKETDVGSTRTPS